MRKYIWMAFLVLVFVAIAGLAHARGGLMTSHGPAGSAAPASSGDSSSCCPLQWLASFCHSGD
jgi:hypothetical protein